MQFDTETAARYAGEKLDSLLKRATRDAATAIEGNDIPKAVTYFAELQSTVRTLAAKISEVQKLVDSLSYETLPTMFVNQDVKTIRLENVGRVTVNVRWSASMIDKEAGLGWLRQTGNDGMIEEYVHPARLGAFAKDESENGAPLPPEIFKTASKPYISIADKPPTIAGK